MLVIRLLRVGKKNQPAFKIVVTEKQNPPKGGRFVEEVGFYNPITKQLVLKKERAQYWLSKGAQPSATIHNLLVKEGVLQDKKIPVHKKPKKKEGKPEETAAKPAAEPAAEKKEETPPAAQDKPEEKPAEKPAEPKEEAKPAEPAKEEKKEAPPQPEEKQEPAK